MEETLNALGARIERFDADARKPTDAAPLIEVPPVEVTPPLQQILT